MSFQENKFSGVKKNFPNQGNFPQSRKSSTTNSIEEFLLRKFDQRSFRHSRKFFKKIWSSKVSTADKFFHKEVFHKKLVQIIFLQSTKFSTKKFFLDQKSFSKFDQRFSTNSKNQKGSLKAKIVDLFDTKSHAKIQLVLSCLLVAKGTNLNNVLFKSEWIFITEH